MFKLESRIGEKNDLNIIMFDELSPDAQKEALEFANILDPSENFWDILPIAYVYKSHMSQNDIDLEALAQIGYYRLSC